MRKEFLKILAGILTLMLCLAGCIKAAGEESAGKRTETNIRNEAGILEFQPEVTGGRLMELGLGQLYSILVYFDYEETAFIPLCTKADCSHVPGNMECTATLLARNLMGICEYQGKLWYLKDITEGRQRMSDPAHVMLCRADLTGENEEELYTWEMQLAHGGGVLYDGYFYCVGRQEHYDENYQLVNFTERLIRVDLESGDLVEVEEEKQTEQVLYQILGFWGGKLYYQYYTQEDYPVGAVIVYDCKTQRKDMFPLAEGELRIACLEEGYLEYEIMDNGQRVVYIMDLEKGEEVMRRPVDSDILCSIMDGELWMTRYREKSEVYDLTTGEYRETDGVSNFFREFSTGDGYVGRIVDRNNYLTEYAYISKEDYEKGGMPTVITKDEYPIW